MTRYIVFGVALFMAVFAWSPYEAVAQEYKQLQAQREAMIERLQLTEAQVKKVEPILDANLESKFLLLEKYGFGSGQKPELSRREKISLVKELQKIQKGAEQSLEAILSKEQMAEYKKIRDENRQKMRSYFKK